LFLYTNIMGNLWGTPLTPTEMMNKSRKSLRQAVRGIEREIERIQDREPDLKLQMKNYARQGKVQAVKLLAKELIRLRNAENKLLSVKIQLESTQHQIESLSSTAAMTAAMKTSVRAMYAMNKQVDAKALQRIMMEFDKQSEFMDMKQEIMNDTIDAAVQGEGDEDAEDMEISRVLDEVGINLVETMDSIPLVGGGFRELPSLDKDMKDRMEKLKK